MPVSSKAVSVECRNIVRSATKGSPPASLTNSATTQIVSGSVVAGYRLVLFTAGFSRTVSPLRMNPSPPASSIARATASRWLGCSPARTTATRLFAGGAGWSGNRWRLVTASTLAAETA